MNVRHFSFLFFTVFLVQGVWSLSNKEECLLDFEIGPDQNYTLSYGFNKTSEQCESFWYGGSGGNDNRFQTLDDCINACDTEDEETAPLPFSPDVCLLQLDAGRYSNWTMYFGYNQETKQCDGFYYGGRGGNANRFKTVEDCIDHCEPLNEEEVLSSHKKEDCLLDMDEGDDDKWKEYFAFDKTENKCKAFFYGGSGGNGNRFNTDKECRWYCKQGE